MTRNDGSTYVGEFFHNKCHGTGTHSYADGRQYTGQWQHNERHGVGTMTWPSGDRYEGQWSHHRYHGHGSYTFTDGRCYVGDMFNDYFHGSGTLTTSNGWYKGEFMHSKRHGQGTRVQIDSHGCMETLFCGQWEDDMFVHGHHVRCDKGASYVGDMRHKIFHGQGVLTMHGNTLRCRFEYGEPIGECEFIDALGNILTGEFHQLNIAEWYDQLYCACPSPSSSSFSSSSFHCDVSDPLDKKENLQEATNDVNIVSIQKHNHVEKDADENTTKAKNDCCHDNLDEQDMDVCECHPGTSLDQTEMDKGKTNDLSLQLVVRHDGSSFPLNIPIAF